jgi:iron complex outermembrane receptor protein
LTEIPGIDISRSAAGGHSGSAVKLRGFDESRCLILLNGRPLNGAGVMGGDYVDWSSLPIEEIEKVEVMKGAHSAEYGNTLGGVINIITSARSEKKAETSIKASYGAFSTFFGSLLHRGHWQDKLFYRFSVDKNSSDGYLRNHFSDFWNLSGQVSADLLLGFSAELSGKYSRQKKGFIVENNAANGFYDAAYPESLSGGMGGPGIQFKEGDYTWGDGSCWNNIRQQYDIRLDKKGKHISLSSALYFNDQQRTEFFYALTEPDELIMKRNSKPEDMTWGWYVKCDQQFKKLSLKYGWEGQHLRYVGSRVSHIDPLYFKVLPESDGQSIDAQTRQAFFIQSSWNLLERMTIQGGLRADFFRGAAQEKSAVPEMKKTGWSPRLNVSLGLWAQAQLEVSLADVLRLPTCPEYYWYYGGFQPANRPELQPERAKQIECGFSQEISNRLIAAARFYYYAVDDYLRTIFGYRPSRVVYNIDQVHLQGIEISSQLKVNPALSVYGNYTFQQSRKRGDSLDLSGVLTGRLVELPIHKANFGLKWNLFSQGDADVKIRYVGKRDVLTGNLAALQTIELIEMKDFVTVSVHTTAQIFKNKNGLNLQWQFMLDNLFDREYQEIYGFPMPGRSLVSGLHFSF